MNVLFGSITSPGTEVRWVTLTDDRGAGLRIDGRPHFELTARRRTSEDLDRAAHPPELAPRASS